MSWVIQFAGVIDAPTTTVTWSLTVNCPSVAVIRST